MAAKPSVWPDPDIRHGHFRVLPRTDGTFAVLDDRLPAGKQTIRVFRSLSAAKECAVNLFKLMSP